MCKMCSIKLIAILPVILSAAVLVYQTDPFNPAPYPVAELTQQQADKPSLVNAHMLDFSDFIGSGHLLGPEDLAYDSHTRFLYATCADGWIKRVDLHDSLVHNWVNTGGRPHGIAFSGPNIIVADAYKGLLRITKDQKVKVEVLTNEAQGLKFKFTDGVDVGKDGTIYFTDASYKYQYHEVLYDIFESRPHGRLLSFKPDTNKTTVLLQNLYFPNGVTVSPDQNSLVFCETPLKRCRRYWLHGSNKGSVDAFIDNLPGYPDNIHGDGQSNYWIAITSSVPSYLEQAKQLKSVRKWTIIVERYISMFKYIHRNGGIYAVDLQGNPTAHIYDRALSSISSGIKIGNHLYVGSLNYPHIIRFNISKS